jgi:hypothetical protein
VAAMDKAYAIGGLAIAACIALISIDLLTGGALSAVLGKAPARLAAVPDPAEDRAS